MWDLRSDPSGTLPGYCSKQGRGGVKRYIGCYPGKKRVRLKVKLQTARQE